MGANEAEIQKIIPIFYSDFMGILSFGGKFGKNLSGETSLKVKNRNNIQCMDRFISNFARKCVILNETRL